MSRAAPPTAEELQATFDELIAGPPSDGSSVPTDTGLDEQTVAAIERSWAAGGNESLATGARHEFAMQLDGTHAREAQARQQLIFERSHAEHAQT